MRKLYANWRTVAMVLVVSIEVLASPAIAQTAQHQFPIKLSVKEIPQGVAGVIKKNFPKAQIISVFKWLPPVIMNEGMGYYEIILQHHSQKYHVESYENTIVLISMILAPADVPASVTNLLAAKHPGSRLISAEAILARNGEPSKTPSDSLELEPLSYEVDDLWIGGGTVGGTGAAILTTADIDNLFGFAAAAGVAVVYSLQLENGNLTMDATTAHYIWQNYRAHDIRKVMK